MNTREKRIKIKELEKILNDLNWEVNQETAKCSHDWKVERKRKESGGYMDPGDPPGMYGIDRRLGGYVPYEVTEFWIRTCSKCGKEERTEKTKDVVVAKEPDFESRW